MNKKKQVVEEEQLLELLQLLLVSPSEKKNCHQSRRRIIAETDPTTVELTTGEELLPEKVDWVKEPKQSLERALVILERERPSKV